MRLLFQHLAGRITHTDWQYTPVYAVFEKTEYEKAFENGWIPHEFDPPLWFQARQVRYDLGSLDFQKKRKIPKRIDFEISFDLKNFDKYEEIWNLYIKFKNFEPSNLERLFSLDKKDKIVIEIYDYDELVAFSIVRLKPCPVSLQFSWTYHDPKLSLGIHCQYFELQYLKELGYKYSYVCPGYEETCIWKSRFPGFQFWDGMSWSSDKNLYEKLCLRDSKIIDPDDLSDDDLIPINYDIKKLENW